MLRNTVSKVAWVGRATVFIVGLSVIGALILGAATVALGATGGNFILGKANSAGASTQLTSAVAGPVLKLVNTGTSTAATALNLSVPSGRAPLTVNASAGKATNLDADELDGRDSSAFLRDGGQLVRWGPETVPSGGRAVFPFSFSDAFSIVGECPSTGGSRITLGPQGSASMPYSVALQSTQGTAKLPNVNQLAPIILTEVSGTPSVGSAMGSAVSHGSDDRSITYDLYQARRTNPSGSEECTFGGYVVKGG